MLDDRLIVAHHECGHCCVALALGKPAAELSLSEGGGGQFREHEVASWEPTTPEGKKAFRDAVLAFYTSDHREEVWPLLLISFGGILAQRRYLGSSALAFEHLDEHDRKQRADLSKAVTTSADEARAFLNSAQAATTEIIERSWAKVTALAGELCLRGRLDADEIKLIIEHGPSARRRRAWDQIVAQNGGATLSVRGM